MNAPPQSWIAAPASRSARSVETTIFGLNPFCDPVLPLHFALKDEAHWVVFNRDQQVNVILQKFLKFGRCFALNANLKRLDPFPHIFFM